MESEDNLNKSGNTGTIKNFSKNSNKKDSKSNSIGCFGCLGLIVIIVIISIIAEGIQSCSKSVGSWKNERIIDELLDGKTYSGGSEWTRVMGALMKASVQIHFSKDENGKLVGDVTYKTYSDMADTHVEHLVCDIVCEYRNESCMFISQSTNIRKKSGDRWGGEWLLVIDYSLVEQHRVPKVIECTIGMSEFSLFLQTSDSTTITSSKKNSSSKIHPTNIDHEKNSKVQTDSLNNIHTDINNEKDLINDVDEKSLSDYKRLITYIYKDAWQYPLGLTDTNAITTAEVKINQDGSIHSSKIIKESGNELLDTSVQKTLKIVGESKLPPLPKGIQKTETVTVDFGLSSLGTIESNSVVIDKSKFAGFLLMNGKGLTDSTNVPLDIGKTNHKGGNLKDFLNGLSNKDNQPAQ